MPETLTFEPSAQALCPLPSLQVTSHDPAVHTSLGLSESLRAQVSTVE